MPTRVGAGKFLDFIVTSAAAENSGAEVPASSDEEVKQGTFDDDGCNHHQNSEFHGPPFQQDPVPDWNSRH